MIAVHSAYAATGKRPWVARITGKSSRFGLERSFVEPFRDFTDAHYARSGRFSGLRLEWLLTEGVYEVCVWVRRGWLRQFMRSEGGNLIEIERAEVDEWIRQNST